MKPKVLTVEDDKGVLALLVNALRSAGFDVVACSTAAEFRTAKAAHPIDVFLIDVGLPDGDGLALVRELRLETDAGIILMSGMSSDEDWDTAMALGADDYLSKPFRLRDLAERVAQVHQTAAERRAARGADDAKSN